MTATSGIENASTGGRTFVGHSEEGEHVAGRPGVAYEAVWATNHLARHGHIPAPTGVRVLGELNGSRYRFEHATSE